MRQAPTLLLMVAAALSASGCGLWDPVRTTHTMPTDQRTAELAVPPVSIPTGSVRQLSAPIGSEIKKPRVGANRLSRKLYPKSDGALASPVDYQLDDHREQ